MILHYDGIGAIPNTMLCKYNYGNEYFDYIYNGTKWNIINRCVKNNNNNIECPGNQWCGIDGVCDYDKEYCYYDKGC